MVAAWPDPVAVAGSTTRVPRLDHAPHRGRDRRPRGARALQDRARAEDRRRVQHRRRRRDPVGLEAEFGYLQRSRASAPSRRAPAPRSRRTRRGRRLRAWRSTCRSRVSSTSRPRRRASRRSASKVAADLDRLEKKLANEGFLAKAAAEIDREGPREGRRARRSARARRRASSPSSREPAGRARWHALHVRRRARGARARARFGINPPLDGIRALTDVLGRPQDALRVGAGHRHQRQVVDGASHGGAAGGRGRAHRRSTRARSSSATPSASRSPARP